jgi:murein DD-endopeptidase MepM/ murein hydrolase activator NlpD
MPKHYTFNSNTLSYETVSIPIKARVVRLLAGVAVGIMVSTIIVYAVSYFFETPRTIVIQQQNDALRMKYDFLMQHFRKANDEINNLLLRDNNVYRSIFEADIIPLQVRESGIASAGSYEKLLANKQTAMVAEALMLMDKIIKKAYVQSKSFDEITIYAHEKEQLMLCIPYIQPVNIANKKIHISALYGLRVDPIFRIQRMHNGIDFAGPVGTPIYTTGNGVIEEARFSIYGFGNTIVVNHGFGHKTRYAHLSDVKVREGDKVARGQVIGLMGNTGKSTGSHLHYEVLLKGYAVNPINFFNDDIDDKEYDKIIEALRGNTKGLGTDF